MAEVLQSNNNWDNPPIPGSSIEVSEEDDQDEDDDTSNDNLEDIMQEVNSSIDPDAVSTSITQLTNAALIDQGLKDHLHSLHKGTFKKVESPGLPIYQLEHDLSSKAAHERKFCAFVEVEHNNKKVFVHKPLQYSFCKKERGCHPTDYFVFAQNNHFLLTLSQKLLLLFQLIFQLYVQQLI